MFHNPDYHCTFAYKKELEKLQWTADIFVDGFNYPSHILWDETSSKIMNFNKRYPYTFWFIFHVPRYEYLIFYGRSRVSKFMHHPRLNKFGFFQKLRISGFSPLLAWATLVRTKIIYLPSGCRDEFTKEEFQRLDAGRVCGNCSFSNHCDDQSNLLNLNTMQKYSKFNIGSGFSEGRHLKLDSFAWKSIDLDLWSPNLEVPDEFKVKKDNKILIYHATSLESRLGTIEKNIKGTSYLMRAIERLKLEGYACELMYFSGIESKNVRYYMVQADIVVDQLIYGSWGSTSIEAMSLGKPTICYLRQEWKDSFLRTFNLPKIPIIEADTRNIYQVLKSLLDSPLRISQIGVESRTFAMSHYNPSKNARNLITKLNQL